MTILSDAIKELKKQIRPNPNQPYQTQDLIDQCERLRATPRTLLRLREFDAVVYSAVSVWMDGHCTWEEAVAMISETSQQLSESCVKNHPELQPIADLFAHTCSLIAVADSVSQEAKCGFLIYMRLHMVSMAIELATKNPLLEYQRLTDSVCNQGVRKEDDRAQ